MSSDIRRLADPIECMKSHFRDGVEAMGTMAPGDKATYDQLKASLVEHGVDLSNAEHRRVLLTLLDWAVHCEASGIVADIWTTVAEFALLEAEGVTLP